MQIQKICPPYLESLWSGGTTTQLCIFPPNSSYASRKFLFRVSSARVEKEESTFTSLPSFDRVIMTLEGDLAVSHDNKNFFVLHPFQPYEFGGEQTTFSKGKVLDFNLIFAKGMTGKMFLFGQKVELEKMKQQQFLFFFCMDGDVELGVNDEIVSLKNQESFFAKCQDELVKIKRTKGQGIVVCCTVSGN